MTIAFDFSVEEIWVPLMAGATLIPAPAGGTLVGEELGEFLRRRHVSGMACCPTLLATIEEDLPELRILLVGGEACPQNLVQRWSRPGRSMLNTYGPTEATVTASLVELKPNRPVTIGRPLPTYAMVILDPAEARALAPGELGEIGIAGIGLARGYRNRDDLTGKKFIPDFLGLKNNPSKRIYRTGDLGRINADGEIEYCGRIDTQVKIRGYRIELGEIEVALGRHPDVRDCAVVAREDGSTGASTAVGTGKRLAAYVVGKNGAAPAAAELRSFLQERLPGYMVPSAFVVLDALPVTVNGKVDRDALPSPEQQSRNLDSPFKAASDSLEMQLVEVWEEILGVRPIGITDNFFDLGGDSLQAVLMAAKVEEIRGGHMPPALVIEENTIEKLARAIHRLDGEPRDGTVVKVQPKGSLPPLYLVPGIGGLALGALIGGAVASRPAYPDYYAEPAYPGYYYQPVPVQPVYPVQRVYPVERVVPVVPVQRVVPAYGGGYSHVTACEARYRSYDPRSDTFLGYDGYRHYCRY